MAGNVKKKDFDILNGTIWKDLIAFALPITMSSILQQMFNAADQAVVGQFAGRASLAAVGANTTVVGLFVNMFSSLSIGSNAQIARAIGAGRRESISRIVHTSITFAAGAGVILLMLAQLLAGTIHGIVGTPEDVMDLAVVYMRIYACGFPFILLYNFGSAILRSKGDTRRPMIALTSAGVLNVILNLIFVIIFRLGVVGVAAATSISNLVSAVWVLIYLLHEEGDMKLMPGKLGVDLESLKSIVKIGGPAAIQSSVFSIANVSIQSGVNSLGSAAVAGSTVATNLEHVSYYITNGFAQAVTTFCGQNYGAGQYDRCRKSIRIAYIENVIGAITVNSIVVLMRVPIVAIFTSDPEVAKYAYYRLMINVALHFMVSSYEVMSGALRGLGYALVPSLLTIIGCVGFRVSWLFTVFAAFKDFRVLMAVYPVSWVVTGTLVIGYYLINRKKIYSQNTAG